MRSFPLRMGVAAALASVSFALDCATCQTLANDAAIVSRNATALKAFVAALGRNCDAQYPSPSNTSALILCEAAASLTGDLLPWLDKQLETLAWDALAVCSTIIPVCTQPCCLSMSRPEQIHFSLLEDDFASYGVTWVTLSHSASNVQWGPAAPGSCSPSSSLPNNFTGYERTYVEGGFLGFVHRAVMAGLMPSQMYCYRVGEAASGVWSDVKSFTTPPSTATLGTVSRPFRILQTGDIAYDIASDGTVNCTTAIVQAGGADIHLQVGDTSYADGYSSHDDAFGRKIEPVASLIPYMTVAGNHESTWWNATAYRNRFYMPGDADSFYYSFNAGPAHIAMINTETFFDTADIDDVQLAWLTADLTAASAPAARAQRPFIIVAGHRPLYCTDGSNSIQCGGFAAWLRERIEDLLYRSKVDVVITAHEHGYERSWPVYKGNVTDHSYLNPTAPVYIVNGAAGNREGNEKPQGNAPWSAEGVGNVAYSLIEMAVSPGPAANCSLTWTHFDSASGQVLDKWVLVKPVPSAE